MGSMVIDRHKVRKVSKAKKKLSLPCKFIKLCFFSTTIVSNVRAVAHLIEASWPVCNLSALCGYWFLCGKSL